MQPCVCGICKISSTSRCSLLENYRERHRMESIFNVIGEIALTLMVIFTSVMMIRLRQDIRELKELLQRQLLSEECPVGPVNGHIH